MVAASRGISPIGRLAHQWDGLGSIIETKRLNNETTKKQDKLDESVIMNKRNVKILTHYFNYKHLKSNKIPKDHELLSLLPIQELKYTYNGLISRIS